MVDADRAILRYPLSWRSWRFRLVAGLMVLVLFVRLAWGWEAGRMLRREIEAARARGEAATLADYHFEAVPDSENAWTLQQKAAQAISITAYSPRNSNDDYKNYPPFPAAWIKRADASEKANVKVFALSRQARGLSRVQSRDGFKPPLLQTLLSSSLYNTRQLAGTLLDGALYSHVRGDDAEAIERIFDAIHVEHSLMQDPVLISQLVANGIDGLVNNSALVIAPGLQMKGSPTARPATVAQARRLIVQLLDEEAVWRGFETSLPMERLFLAEFLETASRGTYLIQPLATMDVVRTNRYLQIAIEASHLRNKPAAMAVLSRGHLDKPVSNSWSRLFGGAPKIRVPRYSRWFLPSSEDLSRYFEMRFRATAERRVAAISLAAQLYRLDHGKWPAKLEELAPAYLPALPPDPYHDDGRAMGYVILKGPGGADRPMVYFDAGPDKAGAVSGEPMYEWNGTGLTGAIRQYRDLSRFVPAPASTQAIKNNP